jgi:hypothetical protein
MRMRLVLTLFVISAGVAGCHSAAAPAPPLPPVPVITSVTPATFVASSAPRTLTITGTAFDGGSGAYSISLSGPFVTPVTLTPASATEFKLTAAFNTPGTYGLKIKIREQESNEVQWIVTAAAPPQ